MCTWFSNICWSAKFYYDHEQLIVRDAIQLVKLIKESSHEETDSLCSYKRHKELEWEVKAHPYYMKVDNYKNTRKLIISTAIYFECIAIEKIV